MRAREEASARLPRRSEPRKQAANERGVLAKEADLCTEVTGARARPYETPAEPTAAAVRRRSSPRSTTEAASVGG